MDSCAPFEVILLWKEEIVHACSHMCAHMNAHTHTCYRFTSHTCTHRITCTHTIHPHKKWEQVPKISTQIALEPKAQPSAHSCKGPCQVREARIILGPTLCSSGYTTLMKEMGLPIYSVLLEETTIRLFFLWNKLKYTPWVEKRKRANWYSNLPGFYKISQLLSV